MISMLWLNFIAPYLLLICRKLKLLNVYKSYRNSYLLENIMVLAFMIFVEDLRHGC